MNYHLVRKDKIDEWKLGDMGRQLPSRIGLGHTSDHSKMYLELKY